MSVILSHFQLVYFKNENPHLGCHFLNLVLHTLAPMIKYLIKYGLSINKSYYGNSLDNIIKQLSYYYAIVELIKLLG